MNIEVKKINKFFLLDLGIKKILASYSTLSFEGDTILLIDKMTKDLSGIKDMLLQMLEIIGSNDLALNNLLNLF